MATKPESRDLILFAVKGHRDVTWLNGAILLWMMLHPKSTVRIAEPQFGRITFKYDQLPSWIKEGRNGTAEPE